MYCPQCARPIDGMKFCRSCGANVSLVPQALSGSLPTDESDESRRGRRRRAGHRQSPERFAKTALTGIAFLVAAVVITFRVPSGFLWGWSMLIPGFACLGEGIAQYLRYRDSRTLLLQQQSPAPPYNTRSIEPNQPAPVIPATSELTPPASVTEETTRHLDAAPRRE